MLFKVLTSCIQQGRFCLRAVSGPTEMAKSGPCAGDPVEAYK